MEIKSQYLIDQLAEQINKETQKLQEKRGQPQKDQKPVSRREKGIKRVHSIPHLIGGLPLNDVERHAISRAGAIYDKVVKPVTTTLSDLADYSGVSILTSNIAQAAKTTYHTISRWVPKREPAIIGDVRKQFGPRPKKRNPLVDFEISDTVDFEVPVHEAPTDLHHNPDGSIKGSEAFVEPMADIVYSTKDGKGTPIYNADDVIQHPFFVDGQVMDTNNRAYVFKLKPGNDAILDEVKAGIRLKEMGAGNYIAFPDMLTVEGYQDLKENSEFFHEVPRSLYADIMPSLTRSKKPRITRADLNEPEPAQPYDLNEPLN